MKNIQIAVDGPAGSGKSSIMKSVAKRLGFSFIDTGLMYRAYTSFLLKDNIIFTDQKAIIAKLNDFHCHFENEDIYVNGENYMNDILQKKVLDNINYVTVIPEVRNFMVKLQQDVASKSNCVLVGRDITTIVLPFATVKIYLDCSVEKRANRRMEQNINAKINFIDYDTIFKMILERDESDKNREVGPLKIAPDAIVVDNSNCTFDQCVDEIYNIIISKI